MASTLFNN